MENILDIIDLVSSCIGKVVNIRKDFLITLAIALFSSSLFGLIASNYTKLWNKKYRNRPIHYILFSLAGILTFLSVFIFSGLRYAEDVANIQVEKWSMDIRSNETWATKTFKEAYAAVVEMGEEDLSNYSEDVRQGKTIPLTLNSSKKKCGEVYSEAVYNDFKNNNPTLSKVVWADSKAPVKKVTTSMEVFFKENEENVYDVSKVISITTQNIKEGLKEKTPNVVHFSRLSLIVIFLLFQLLAFGVVGYDAYKDLKLAV